MKKLFVVFAIAGAVALPASAAFSCQGRAGNDG